MQSIMQTVKTEITVKNSKFIGYMGNIESAADADGFLERLRKKHSDATHIVYAYRTVNNEMKYSDANEPAGSAGKPVYNIIEKNELYNVIIAVIRYFGGVKLGIGGLVRAYSSTAASLYEIADIRELVRAAEILLTVPYKLAPILENKLRNMDYTRILSIDYKTEVTFDIIVRENLIEEELSGRNILSRIIRDSIFVPF
ncbi:MAG: YigZ family protein [bacterium]